MEEEEKQRGQRKRYVKLSNKATLIDDIKVKNQLEAELSFWTAQSSLPRPPKHPLCFTTELPCQRSIAHAALDSIITSLFIVYKV